jgi:hypothetical protein
VVPPRLYDIAIKVDPLNKIDEILESDDDIQELLVTSAYEME